MVRLEMFRLRRAAARRQKMRCHYCGAQMWLRDGTAFVARFVLTADQAARFQCTAEHLVARRDGGANAKSNVVAACRFCNVQRHDEEVIAPLDHFSYRAMVRQRIDEGSWHPRWAMEKGILEPASGACKSPEHALPG